jgi:hypothetical protein
VSYSAGVHFELPGATIAFRALDARDAATVRAELDPYEPSALDEEADVVVVTSAAVSPRLEDVQNPSADGRVTAWDGRRLYLLEGNLTCALPPFGEGPPFFFERGQGFPLRPLLRLALRPALQLALLERGFVAVHGTTVEHEGSGIVVAGWSESGKTETALAFLERGAAFVSDKWTILSADRELAPFPISVGIRRWVLPYLARLRRGLPATARAQLALAAAISTATWPVRRARPSGMVGRLASTTADRVVALAERAALAPSQLSRVYGAARPLPRTRLSALVLLTTVADADVVVRTADPIRAARRLARSAAYERRDFFDLHRRTQYAMPAPFDDLERAVTQREEELLSELLQGVPVLEANAPFPTDPRRAANALAERLP